MVIPAPECQGDLRPSRLRVVEVDARHDSLQTLHWDPRLLFLEVPKYSGLCNLCFCEVASRVRPILRHSVFYLFPLNVFHRLAMSMRRSGRAGK